MALVERGNGLDKVMKILEDISRGYNASHDTNQHLNVRTVQAEQNSMSSDTKSTIAFVAFGALFLLMFKKIF